MEHRDDSPADWRARHVGHNRALLQEFANSPATFQILHSFPTPFPPKPKTLYILDSSFNPPTLAHLHLAVSALLQSSDEESADRPSSSSRLLLLLATQNADKAPQPAAFEQRLAMLEAFAREIVAQLPSPSSITGVDIGVTTCPYFVDKALAIAAAAPGGYEPRKIFGEAGFETEQVHLIGYDTLTRILDPKYYPPGYDLERLVPFLEKHRLRVTFRTDDKWGSRSEQERFVREIGEGSLDAVGGKREWVSKARIELVEGVKEGDAAFSSTRVREAAKKKDWDEVRRLVLRSVSNWIRDEELYVDD